MELSTIYITVWICTHPGLAWSVSCPGEYPSRRSKFWPPWFTQVSITKPISKVPNCNTYRPEMITFKSRCLVVVNSLLIEFCQRSLPKSTCLQSMRVMVRWVRARTAGGRPLFLRVNYACAVGFTAHRSRSWDREEKMSAALRRLVSCGFRANALASSLRQTQGVSLPAASSWGEKLLRKRGFGALLFDLCRRHSLSNFCNLHDGYIGKQTFAVRLFGHN